MGAAAIFLAAQTLGNMFSGFAEAAALDANADIAERNAKQVKLDTIEMENRFRRQARKQAGAREASRGASGIQLTGSAFDVMLDSQIEEELQVATIRHAGKTQAMSLMLQAQMDRKAAHNTRVGAVLGSAGNAGKGYAQGKSAGLF